MKSVLCERLNFKLNPVAVFFTDEKPSGAFEAKEGQRICAASMLIAAAKNSQVAAFSEKTYGCPGGGAGLCFGNAFKAAKFPIDALLSNGDEVLAARGEEFGRKLGKGERFFASAPLAREWAGELPYTKTTQKYVVFKPLLLADENEKPDLVCFFANPDQLSILVIAAGYWRGKSLNVVAPFVSACQSILLAYQEIKKEMPKAIMGYFDISQRANIPKEILSLTVPFSLYEDMERSAKIGAMETASWERIKDRWQE